MIWLMLLLIGLLAGVLSGMFGIGGGIIIVPLLTLLLGFAQHTATGTSLLVFLLPVGFLGALSYFKAGKVSMEHVQYAAVIATSLFFGSFIGSKFALMISEDWLRKGFAILLVILALRLWLDD